jgi:UDP-N-acetylmuramate dehydrogenase
VIEAVQTIEKSTLLPRTFSAKDCRFGYRQSRFKADDLDKFIITSVTFRLSQTQEPEPRYEELKASLGLDPAWQTATRVQRLNLMSAHVTKIRASKGMVIDPRDPDTKSVGSFFMNPVVPQPLKEKVEGIAAAEKLVRPFVAHHVGNNLWKLSAAWLIESSGINKGQILAGAKVSTKHVLALTNPGHASTKDILDFADFITTKVEQKFGVRLEREPVVVP